MMVLAVVVRAKARFHRAIRTLADEILLERQRQTLSHQCEDRGYRWHWDTDGLDILCVVIHGHRHHEVSLDRYHVEALVVRDHAHVRIFWLELAIERCTESIPARASDFWVPVPALPVPEGALSAQTRCERVIISRGDHAG